MMDDRNGWIVGSAGLYEHGFSGTDEAVCECPPCLRVGARWVVNPFKLLLGPVGIGRTHAAKGHPGMLM